MRHEVVEPLHVQQTPHAQDVTGISPEQPLTAQKCFRMELQSL